MLREKWRGTKKDRRLNIKEKDRNWLTNWWIIKTKNRWVSTKNVKWNRLTKNEGPIKIWG